MLTLEQLALRRHYTAAAAKRHKPRGMPKAQPPRGLVIAYTRELLALSRAMDKVLFDAMHMERVVRMDRSAKVPEPIYPAPLPPLPSQTQRIMTTVRAKFAKMAQAMTGTIDKMGARVAHWTGQQWGKQLKALVGIDQAPPVDMVPLMRDFRQRNISLIVSLGEDKLARARKVLETITHESDPADVARQLREQADVTESRAALIATDQIHKLDAQCTQVRHEAAGVREYTWETAHDERVRPGHAVLDGKVFSYSHPPDTGNGPNNPGMDIRCRCIAAPKVGVIGRIFGIAA